MRSFPRVCLWSLSLGATEKMLQVKHPEDRNGGALPRLTPPCSPPPEGKEGWVQVVGTGMGGGPRASGKGLTSLKGPWYW